MISIFFVICDFSGAKSYGEELISYLNKQDNITLYVVYFESRYFKEYTEVQNDQILNIHIPPVKTGNINLTKYSNRCLDLISHLLKDKDNLIFHLNYSNQVKFGINARKRYKAKIIYTFHFLPSNFTLYSKYNIKKETIIESIQVLEKEIINEADLVICVTDFAKNMVIDLFEKPETKVYSIYNGIGYTQVANLLNKKEKEKLKRKLGFDINEQIILYVGKLEQRKGVKFLIEAFKVLVKQYPSYRLVIAGNGEFEAYMLLCKGIRGKVTFTGNIEKNELSSLYQIASIGVIPSIFEQCSYVALEMLQNGLPIVSSDAPGLIELFENNSALIVPLRKTNDLTGIEIIESKLVMSIKRIITNQTFAEQLGNNALNQWRNNFTSEHMGHTTLQLYKQI